MASANGYGDADFHYEDIDYSDIEAKCAFRLEAIFCILMRILHWLGTTYRTKTDSIRLLSLITFPSSIQNERTSYSKS